MSGPGRGWQAARGVLEMMPVEFEAGREGKGRLEHEVETCSLTYGAMKEHH